MDTVSKPKPSCSLHQLDGEHVRVCLHCHTNMMMQLNLLKEHVQHEELECRPNPFPAVVAGFGICCIVGMSLGFLVGISRRKN